MVDRLYRRKLLEAKKQKDGTAVEPGIIMLKLTVKKGGAEPALVLCNGHSAKLLLANYLVRNSLCDDNVAKLLENFQEGGDVSLKTFHPWYRLLYAGKGEALQQRFFDIIGMLCLCSGGGKPMISSPLKFSTDFVCGDGCNTREVPWKAKLFATVEVDGRPEKWIGIRRLCQEDNTLYLGLRVRKYAISSINNQASLASAVQNVPQVKNVVLLLLNLYSKIG